MKIFKNKFSRGTLVVFSVVLVVFGGLVSYKNSKIQAQSKADLSYAGLSWDNGRVNFSELQRSDGTYHTSGNIEIGPDNKIRIRNNVIDSGNIKDKAIKNEDINTGAVNSRTIKNGSISSSDIDADVKNGFLRNTSSGLSWDKLSLSDISIPTIGNPSVMTNLGNVFDYLWSAGIISGGDITDNGNGSVNISAGEAMLRTYASDIAPLKSLSFSGRSNIFMVDGTTNYLWVNYHGGDPQVETSTSLTDYNCLEKCHLYTIIREGTELAILDGREQNVDSNRKLRRKNYETNPFAHVTGGSVLGSSSRHLTLSSGAFYYSLQKISHNVFDTSLAGTSDDRVFESYYGNGSGGWTEASDVKEIDNQNYDDGSGVLNNTASDGHFIVHWIYIIIGQKPRLATIYGTNNYSTIIEAQAETAPVGVPTSIKGAGFLVGRVIIAKSFNDIDLVESAFTSSFTGSGIGISSYTTQEQQKEIKELQNKDDDKYVKDNSGVEIIPVGKDFVEVKTATIKNNSKILITFENNPEAYNWVERQKDSENNYIGFKIFIAAEAKTDLKVDWSVINSE
jgi:hypothetical protein